MKLCGQLEQKLELTSILKRIRKSVWVSDRARLPFQSNQEKSLYLVVSFHLSSLRPLEDPMERTRVLVLLRQRGLDNFITS